MSDGHGRGIEWIEYASRYLRSFRKLPPAIRQKIREREVIFRSNPFDARLKTHKLHGEFNGFWAYSIEYRYRVVFRFINGSQALFFDVGLHPVYRKGE